MVFFSALVIQSLIQPLLLIQIAISAGIALEKVVEYIRAQEMLLIIPVSLWYGFVASTVQSTLKYVFVKGKSYVVSANLGAGFGLTEAFFVGVSALIAQLITALGRLPTPITLEVPIYYSALISLERLSALLFHFGSTLYIFDSAKAGKPLQGLLAIIALHALIDFLAAFTQFTENPIALAVTELTALLVGLALTFKFYKKAVEEQEEKILY